MSAYAKTGPFTTAQPPAVDSTFLNKIEDALVRGAHLRGTQLARTDALAVANPDALYVVDSGTAIGELAISNGVTWVVAVGSGSGGSSAWKGAWAPATAYAVNDLVTYNGSTYRATIAHTSGATFLTGDGGWQVVALAGSVRSNDTVPTAKAYLAANTNHANGDLIAFNTKAWDTNGILAAPVTNTQTIRTPGKYLVSVQVTDNATAAANEQYIKLRKNGVEIAYGDFVAATSFARIAEVVDCAAGDTLTVQLASPSLRVIAGGEQYTHIEIIWLGGPGVATTEVGTPACVLTHNANQAPASGAALAFNTVLLDTDGMTVAANKITIKTPGIYQVSALVEATPNNSTSANDWRLVPRKNGANIGDMPIAPNDYSSAWSRPIKCAAGDVLDLVYVSSGTSNWTVTANERGLIFGAAYLGSGKTVIPRARVYRSAALSHPTSGSWQKIVFDAIESGQDNDGMFDAVNGRLVCRTAGSYKLDAALMLGTTAAGVQRIGAITVNGKLAGEHLQPTTGNALFARITVDGGTWDLAVGDYIEVWAYQDSGGALAYNLTDNPAAGGTAGNTTWLSAVKVGQSGPGANNDPGWAQNGNDLQNTNSGVVRVRTALAEPIVTSLPANPVDGQIINFLADATNGIVWRLRYRAFQADGVTPNPSPYKWEYLGGDELRVEINTSNNTYTVTGFTNSPGVPQLVIPLAGDYILEVGNGYCGPNTNTNYDCGIKVGAVAPAQPVMASLAAGAGGNIRSTIARRARKNAIAAGTTLTHQFDGTGNGACDQPFMAAVPVRVG